MPRVLTSRVRLGVGRRETAVNRQGISDRSLVIGVMGLGYVGLPLCHTFHKVGYSVIGFDTDRSKITALEVRNASDGSVSVSTSPAFTMRAGKGALPEAHRPRTSGAARVAPLLRLRV